MKNDDPTTYVALFCREDPPRCRLCANPRCTHTCHDGDSYEPGLGWPRNERQPGV